MKPKVILALVVVVLIVGGIIVASKWEGSTAEETADQVLDEITGKRVIDQGKQLTGQLDAIQEQRKSEADSLER